VTVHQHRKQLEIPLWLAIMLRKHAVRIYTNNLVSYLCRLDLDESVCGIRGNYNDVSGSDLLPRTTNNRFAYRRWTD
jgi:hypothetical protein